MEAGKITNFLSGFFLFWGGASFFSVLFFFPRKWRESGGWDIVCFWGKEKERNDGLIEMKFHIDLQFQPEMLRWRVRGEGGRCNGHSLFLFYLSKKKRSNIFL